MRSAIAVKIIVVSVTSRAAKRHGAGADDVSAVLRGIRHEATSYEDQLRALAAATSDTRQRFETIVGTGNTHNELRSYLLHQL